MSRNREKMASPQSQHPSGFRGTSTPLLRYYYPNNVLTSVCFFWYTYSVLSPSGFPSPAGHSDRNITTDSTGRETMIAYKLMRKMKDGYSPLFINKKQRIQPGTWLTAEQHKTKGFAYRPGFHCCYTPSAPHLSERNRVWVKVEVEDCTVYDRPASQGGKWVLASRMKIIGEIN